MRSAIISTIRAASSTPRQSRRLVDAEDVDRFKALTDKLVKQYDAYEPLPGLHVKGELTLGENIADSPGWRSRYEPITCR